MFKHLIIATVLLGLSTPIATELMADNRGPIRKILFYQRPAGQQYDVRYREYDYGRESYYPPAQWNRQYYPKYYYGFNSRYFQNMGVPTGDIGLRGTAW